MLKAVIHLLERYVNDRSLTDKDINLIDESGARSKMDGSGKKTAITKVCRGFTFKYFEHTQVFLIKQTILLN